LILAGNRGWYDEEVYSTIAAANASILARDKRRSGKERRSGLDTRSEEQKNKEGERRKGEERRKRDPIKYIGYITNEEKFALMANAKSFVFPSIYEGFGLPILEAMSVGTSVITSNTSSLSELADDGCGFLVDPSSEAEISNAMQSILTDEGFSESARKSCFQKTEQFSWKKCAQETLEVYKSALNK
jgi:glycosyltransferase involved in cell wall biosynthesis